MAASAASAQFQHPVQAPAELARALELRDAQVQDLALPMASDQSFNVRVQLGEQARTLALDPHDIRSPDFKLLVDDGNGNLTRVPTPPSVTFRGRVVGEDESVVAASLIDGQLQAMILMPDETWGIKPASEGMAGLPRRTHVVYRESDLFPENFRCGVDAMHGAPVDAPATVEDPIDGPNLLIAQIALDLDFEFYTRNGSSVTNAQNDATNVMNSVDAIYQRDTNLGYIITTMIVRSGGNPASYSVGSSSALLSAFRNHWNSNHGNVVRDVAHLLTGKNNWSSTIGIASLGVICSSSSGYGLSHSKETSRRVGLTAHELGHNWNAGHCNGNPGGCRIMCSGLGGCGGTSGFAPPSVTTITNYAANRGCLTITALDPPTLSTMTLNSASNYNLVPPVVTITGVELDSVTSVTVGSESVLIGAQSPTSLTFQIPNGHEIGNLNVVATNNVGPSNPLPFTVTGTHPPVLVAPALHNTGINWAYETFTDANWTSIYLMSGVNGTTAIPGIVSFDIGGGLLGQIFTIATLAADNGGYANVTFPMPPGLPIPFTLYWECMTFDPSVPLAQQTPIETTNSVAVLTFF